MRGRSAWLMVVLSINGKTPGNDRPRYLKSYDADAHGGLGDLETTASRVDARRFATIGEALCSVTFEEVTL